MRHRYTIDLDPINRGRSTVGGLGPRRFSLEGLTPVRVVQGGLVDDSLYVSISPVPRGTQVSYPAAVDLMKGYGKMSRSGLRWIYLDGLIVKGSAGSTPSSSYSLRVINPERPSVTIVDISYSDFETVDGPAGTEMDIEEDPTEPTTGSTMDTVEWLNDVLRTEASEKPLIEPTSVIPASPTSLYEGSISSLPVSSPLVRPRGHRLQAAESQIATLQAELARTSRRFHSSHQARQLETTRADRFAAEVAHMRGTLEAQHHVLISLLITGMLHVRIYPWLRKMSGPHSPSHGSEAMS
ncbi:hypothetical protein M9H77_30479 [Catharanthus roseus]|uniref:Uncharacterized protein n=1 Tax=Catharanthus roseus TaxID=4058 RepID=A0ACB9ZXD6_CATRO|nr:hypothetical protein M9H77_30479 [Catharanthus roseus]